jgi:membrane-anchored mycosin MYCP
MRAGTALDDRALGAALSYAVDTKNVVVVAAAGNAGTGQCTAQQVDAASESATVVVSPAWYDDYVLTVGSVSARGEPSSFSLAGPWVDVAAPGEGVMSLSSAGAGLADSLVTKQGSVPLSGTSYAAPVVSGLAALVRSRFPTWTARQVMQRIKATAHHPARGSDPRVGAGVVDFLAAVSTDSPMAEAPPVARTSVPVAAPALLPSPDRRARLTAFTGAAACGAVLAVSLSARAVRNRLRRMASGDRNITSD